MSNEKQDQDSPKVPKKRTSKISDRLAMFEQQASASKTKDSAPSPKKAVPLNKDKAKNLASVFEQKKPSESSSQDKNEASSSNQDSSNKNDSNDNNNASKVTVPKVISGGIAARLAAINASSNSNSSSNANIQTNANSSQKNDDNNNNNNNNNDSVKKPVGKLGSGINIPMMGLKPGALPPSLLKKRQEQQAAESQGGQLQSPKFDRPIIKTKRRPKTHHDLSYNHEQVDQELSKYLKEHFEYDNGMIIPERFLLQHLQECAGIDLHKNLEMNHNANDSKDDMMNIQNEEEDSKMVENKAWDVHILDEAIIQSFGKEAKHMWGYQIRLTN